MIPAFPVPTNLADPGPNQKDKKNFTRVTCPLLRASVPQPALKSNWANSVGRQEPGPKCCPHLRLDVIHVPGTSSVTKSWGKSRRSYNRFRCRPRCSHRAEVPILSTRTELGSVQPGLIKLASSLSSWSNQRGAKSGLQLLKVEKEVGLSVEQTPNSVPPASSPHPESAISEDHQGRGLWGPDEGDSLLLLGWGRRSC